MYDILTLTVQFLCTMPLQCAGRQTFVTSNILWNTGAESIVIWLCFTQIKL